MGSTTVIPEKITTSVLLDVWNIFKKIFFLEWEVGGGLEGY